MKTYSLLLIFMVASMPFYGQMVVDDPRANAALLETILQGKKTLEETQKTVSLLEENKNLLVRISGALRDAKTTMDILSLQKRILTTTTDRMNYIKSLDSFSVEELSNMSFNFQRILQGATQLVTLSNQLLSEGIFKMDDAQRLEALKNISGEMNDYLSDVSNLSRNYERIAKDRMLNQIFK